MKAGGCGLIAWLVAAIMGLALTLQAAVSAADDSNTKLTLTLNAGETYVIDGLSPDTPPNVTVLDNPQALVLNSRVPGKLMLVGTEAGRWEVQTRRANGQAVTYEVKVNSIGHPFNDPLAPGKSPAALADGKSIPLDSGSGSVTGAASSINVPTGSSKPDVAASSPLTSPGTASVSQAKAGALVSLLPPPNTQASSESALAGAGRGFRSDPPLTPERELEASPRGLRHLPADVITLMADSSEIFDFSHRLKRVSIANSKIADVQVTNPYQLNLVAHEPGFTTLAVWDNEGNYEERQVRVDRSGKQQVLLNVIVAELNRSRLENQGINYSAALTNLGLSIFGLPGAVGTPYTASANLNAQAVAGVGSTAIIPPAGTLPGGGSIIPLLLSQNVTYGLAAGNSSLQTQTFFQFLEQHRFAKVLAQPHLLANTGEKAEFLSGGEIPIVVAQALNTSIVFKRFGTSVSFLPTVVGRDQIELEVNPEVSAPDFVHGVQMFGFTIPAFVTRKASTVVRLRDNQTLIIAGLILNNRVSSVDKTPYLGDIPLAGALFRTTSYENQVTDLVMSVTPQLVGPLPEGGQVFLPTSRPPLTSREIQTQRTPLADVSRPRF
jgi:Flp pilus assembly secretin CpaC